MKHVKLFAGLLLIGLLVFVGFVTVEVKAQQRAFRAFTASSDGLDEDEVKALCQSVVDETLLREKVEKQREVLDELSMPVNAVEDVPDGHMTIVMSFTPDHLDFVLAQLTRNAQKSGTLEKTQALKPEDVQAVVINGYCEAIVAREPWTGERIGQEKFVKNGKFREDLQITHTVKLGEDDPCYVNATMVYKKGEEEVTARFIGLFDEEGSKIDDKTVPFWRRDKMKFWSYADVSYVYNRGNDQVFLGRCTDTDFGVGSEVRPPEEEDKLWCRVVPGEDGEISASDLRAITKE